MKNLQQTLSNAVEVAKGAKVPVSSSELTPEQRKAVGYFFARLKMISSQQYDLLMPDSKTESLIKREYAPHLIAFTKNQIDIGLEAFHSLRQRGDPDYKFLDLDKIIGLIGCNGHKPGEQPPAGIYKPFPKSHRIESETLKSKRKRAGESCLAGLKAMLGEQNRSNQDENKKSNAEVAGSRV